MPITPEGRLSLPVQYLINTLADSARFRTAVTAFDAASAKAKIWWGGLDEDETNAPPRAIVRLGQGQNLVRKTTGGWEASGTLELLITLMNPVGYDYPDAYKSMLNGFGLIRDEMLALVIADPGAGPYLDITGMTLDYVGQWEVGLDGTEDYWDAVYTVFWRGI